MQLEIEPLDGMAYTIEVDPVTNALGIWDTETEESDRYNVIHIPTSKFICHTYDHDRARQIIGDLDALGDWSQPVETMRDSGLFDRAKFAIAHYPETQGW
jgi:hypothetical protein